MPVPIPVLKIESDIEKVKIFTIFGRPKTGFFQRFRGVPGGSNPLDMDTLAARKAYSGLLGTIFSIMFGTQADGGGEGLTRLRALAVVEDGGTPFPAGPRHHAGIHGCGTQTRV